MVDGRILEFDASQSVVSEKEIQSAKMQRGKWSIAVKAIRKAYFKVPPKIRGYINRYVGLNAILGTLDHFTGWIEDGIYQACKRAGMPDWMAWSVAKALTLVAL